MRIISGSAKGLKLRTPKGLDVRPTGDRVKESLFSILADRMDGAAVADLYAGTGSLGIEALSRGAASAVFVDSSPSSLAIARDNAARARLIDRADFLRMDVVTAVDRFGQAGHRFDLIFSDPPYNRGLVSTTLRHIDSSRILSPGGIVVLEHSRHEPLPDGLANLTARRTVRYGETLVSFLIPTT